MTATLEPPVTASTRSARLSAWVAVLAVLVGLAFAPPWQQGGGVPAGFAARLIDGDLARQAGDAWVPVRAGGLVPEGTTVRTLDGATLEVRGGQVALADGSRALLDADTTLEAGSLLTEVGDRARTVRVGPLAASGRGTWRVDAGTTPRVAVYDGGVGIRPAGATSGGLSLARFEQAEAAGGQLPGRPLPIDYDASDPWDARLLSPLFAVDRAAEQLGRSFTATYGTSAQPAEFYRRFTIVDEPLAAAVDRFAGVEQAGRLGPPADVLLAAVVVDLLRDRAGLPSAAAVADVDDLRAAGATWGVVLARHDLTADDLRAAVDLALRGAPTSAPIAPVEAGGTAPGGTPGNPGSPGGTPDGDREPRQPDDEPTDGPSDGPSDGSSEAPGPCQLEPCEPVNETVDEVTDVIDDVAPGTGETIDELISEVPTILPSDSSLDTDIGGAVDDAVGTVEDTVDDTVGGTVDSTTDGLIGGSSLLPSDDPLPAPERS